jgi:hypothetical protein
MEGGGMRRIAQRLMRRFVQRFTQETALVVGLLAGLTAGAVNMAAAQPAPPAAETPKAAPTQMESSPDARAGRRTEERYTFSPRGDAFVRLDHVTGEVSFCAPRAAGWACQAAPEERTALEKEIGRLQDANAELKRQLAARDLAKPDIAKPDSAKPEASPPASEDRSPDTPSPDARLRLPKNEDFERAVDYARKVWRHMLDMLNDLQKDTREKI